MPYNRHSEKRVGTFQREISEWVLTVGEHLASIRTFLQNAYGTRHANTVLAFIQNSPAHIQAMWDDYAAKFRATDMYRGERGAYYSPMDDRVHRRIDSVARGDIIHAPYATLFHEYGHMTDYGPFTCWFSYVLVVAERTLFIC